MSPGSGFFATFPTFKAYPEYYHLLKFRLGFPVIFNCLPNSVWSTTDGIQNLFYFNIYTVTYIFKC